MECRLPSSSTILIAATIFASAACTPPVVSDLAIAATPSPAASPSPAVTAWTRGSLVAPFQLTPRSEYARLAPGGIAMTDSDFLADGVVHSAKEKLAELGASIADERAASIPFRGNPSDVKIVHAADGTKAYIPLGGDLMTPGNEVAVVTVTGTPALRARIRVGVRPQRLAVHPAGLVVVCNQYSNYLSILDPSTDEVLTKDGKPVEIQSEYFCSDLVFVPRDRTAPAPDQQFLYVANRFRKSVLKYAVDVERDATGKIAGVSQSFVTEIADAGSNPFRLATSSAGDALYVASNRGGDLARIDLATDTVSQRVSLGAPTADVVSVSDLVFVPTTMPDRGLLANNEPRVPQQVTAAPFTAIGLDGRSHVAHPGAMFDGTRSYDFEDVRNGLFQEDFELSGTPAYYTDDVSPEPNFVAAQKILAGALPTTVIRNAAGTRLYLALGGSDLVQELSLDTANRPHAVSAVAGGVFATGARPFGLALDEEAGRLYVADWGGEVLEIFDLAGKNRLAEVDLGYALPRYPATNVERGEYWFYEASWSNNGRKSCASCHFDELVSDGVGFSNGATAPTAYHQVKPNQNLFSTDGYFWNGSFSNGSYRSLAFAAQTRTNCEIVLYGMVEGPSSDPATRIGDPNDAVTGGSDEACRPLTTGTNGLPSNLAEARAVIAEENAIGAARIQQATGFDPDTLSRLIDVYSVSELRLPPNPLSQMRALSTLDSGTTNTLEKGEALFRSSGCASCHSPDDTRHPFTDGLNKGRGADWLARFVDHYASDSRVLSLMGGLPETMVAAVSASTATSDPNVVLDPIDFFVPFCFDADRCLSFDDPLAAPDEDEETRRLELLFDFDLAVPSRGFVPGNVRGQQAVNTPSLRGVSMQANLLHHGLARTVREAILAPGHPALQDGEKGFAIDSAQHIDVHGDTSSLSADDVDALVLYVRSIE